MRRSEPSVIDLSVLRTPWGTLSMRHDTRPVPVPPISDVPTEAASLHLTETDPIDDPAGVALQVALLTATVRDLVARVEELEQGKDDGR